MRKSNCTTFYIESTAHAAKMPSSPPCQNRAASLAGQSNLPTLLSLSEFENTIVMPLLRDTAAPASLTPSKAEHREYLVVVGTIK